MSSIDKLKRMHVLRWILIPIVGFVLNWAVGAVLFIGALISAISFDALPFAYGFFVSLLIVLACSILAPIRSRNVLLILWGLSFIPIVPSLMRALRADSEMGPQYFGWLGFLGWLIGGLLAIAMLRFWFNPERSSQSTKRVLVGSGILIVALFAMWYAWFVDFTARPDPIPAQLYNTNVKAFYSYRLAGFLDETYLWKFETDEATIRAIATKFNVRETDTVPEDFFIWRPHWWPDELPQNFLAFKTEGFVFHERPSDGAYYFLLYDKDKQQAFVWLDANF